MLTTPSKIFKVKGEYRIKQNEFPFEVEVLTQSGRLGEILDDYLVPLALSGIGYDDYRIHSIERVK